MPLILDGTTGASLIATTAIPASVVLSTPASGVLTNCTGAVVAALSTASGSAPSYSARAWVNFNAQGTIAIRDSGNVSSITDVATGTYFINFTTAMADVNYAVSFAVSDDSTANRGINIQGDNTTNFLTTGYRMGIFANADPFWVCTLAIR